MNSRLITLIAAGVSLGSVACTAKTNSATDTGMAAAPAGTAPSFDKAAAEAEIRKVDTSFFTAVTARDANAIGDTYARDAVSNPPNSPPLVGHDAIVKYNQEFLKLPKLAMTGEATTIKFSDDGTMGYETGKYTATWVDKKGKTIKDNGKYLNVWQKVDGKWKVVVDAFSSNAAPAM